MEDFNAVTLAVTKDLFEGMADMQRPPECRQRFAKHLYD